MLMWFSLAFCYYGVMYTLPAMLAASNSSSNTPISKNEYILDILYSVLSEFPSFILMFLLIDLKKVGRKGILLLCYSIACTASFIAFITEDHISLWASIVKFSIFTCFEMMFIFTAENYDTSLRSTATGFNNMITRIGASVMPWIGFYMIDIKATGPFLPAGIVTAISIAAVILTKTDTRGVKLD